MNNESEIRRMKKMRFLFLVFVCLVPSGIGFTVASPYKLFGLILFGVGGIAAVVCAFISCPCCSRLNGVFFKGFVGGVFPLGFCVHCGSSYLGAKGCRHDS